MEFYRTELKKIIQALKDEDWEVRAQAIYELQVLQQISMNLQIKTLEWLAKEAASDFPVSKREEDDPSYHIVSFLSDFQLEDIKGFFAQNYNGYSQDAKKHAIHFIASYKDEDSLDLALDLVGQDIQQDLEALPVFTMITYPSLGMAFLEKYLSCIERPHFKQPMYRLLSFILDHDYVRRFHNNYLTPILLKDYLDVKAKYLVYDKDYTPKFAHAVWKDAYLDIRDSMSYCLSLMEYYFTDECKKELTEALSFRDPVIRCASIITCLQKNIAIDSGQILACATNLETSVAFYRELVRIHKEHLYPIGNDRQQYFAKNLAFQQALEMEDGCPDNLDIRTFVDSETPYGEKVRYYLIRVSYPHKHVPIWAGGFLLSDEDGVDLSEWQGTRTVDEEYDSRTEEEHIEQFLLTEENEIKEFQDTIFYESEPKGVDWFIYVMYAFLLYNIYDIYINLEDLGFTLITAALLVGVITYHIFKNRKAQNRVFINGASIIYARRKEQESVLLKDIQKVKIEGNNVIIHTADRKNSLAIPIKEIEYEVFAVTLAQLTQPLRNQPSIENIA